MKMAKLRTANGLVVFVNPDHVSHIWEHAVDNDACTLVLGGRETEIKGSAQHTALLLQAEANHGS